MVKLPDQFSDLEPFNRWSMSTEEARIKELDLRTEEELNAFYRAVLPQLNAIVVHLNRFQLERMPQSETALFNLAKMMMEVATVVEHGRSVIGQYFDVARFVPLDDVKG